MLIIDLGQLSQVDVAAALSPRAKSRGAGRWNRLIPAGRGLSLKIRFMTWPPASMPPEWRASWLRLTNAAGLAQYRCLAQWLPVWPASALRGDARSRPARINRQPSSSPAVQPGATSMAVEHYQRCMTKPDPPSTSIAVSRSHSDGSVEEVQFMLGRAGRRFAIFHFQCGGHLRSVLSLVEATRYAYYSLIPSMADDRDVWNQVDDNSGRSWRVYLGIGLGGAEGRCAKYHHPMSLIAVSCLSPALPRRYHIAEFASR